MSFSFFDDVLFSLVVVGTRVLPLEELKIAR